MPSQFDSFIVNENTVRNFLKRHGNGYKSKDHEFAVAIYIKRLFENQWKTECCLAFQLKQQLKVDPKNPGFEDIDKIRDIFREQIKESTPIDFLLLKGNPYKHSNQGYAFQLKRFGIDIKKNFKKNLLHYLKVIIPKKFGDCGEVALIVIVDLDENLESREKKELETALNFNYFRKKLILKTYPFKKIFLFGLNEKNIHLTEVWPGDQQFIATRQAVGLA